LGSVTGVDNTLPAARVEGNDTIGKRQWRTALVLNFDNLDFDIATDFGF
jgi:hypothetical protein